MDSIIQNNREKCFICGAYTFLEEHHIFGGALRTKSDKLGLTVYLCHFCHNEPPDGVHHNNANMLSLKQIGQQAAMDFYNWTIDDFRREFYKNYL